MMRRFYIENLKTNEKLAIVKGSEAKHIINVLRLKPGDKVILFDNMGVEYEAAITESSPGLVEFSILNSIIKYEESNVQIAIAQAFLKDKKMDILIRGLTELGITTWIPFIADRSIPQPDINRLNTRIEKWRKIVIEALKQCQNNFGPSIVFASSFEEVLSLSKNYDLKIIFWENAVESIKTAFSKNDKNLKKIMIIIGPEGGFSKKEIDAAKSQGFITASLGHRILRSETAAITACAIIQYATAGDVKKN